MVYLTTHWLRTHAGTTTTKTGLNTFTAYLQLAINAYEAAQQPITNRIVRPLQQGTQIFAERGTPSSAIWGRFTARLKAMDMHDGESVHITTPGKIIESSIVDQAKLRKSKQPP